MNTQIKTNQNPYKAVLAQYAESLLDEKYAEGLMIEAIDEAILISIQKGAAINEMGSLDFNNDGSAIGYSQYGIHLRDALLKRIPEELKALVIKLRPSEHLGRWNHPYSVGEVFWGAYTKMNFSEEELNSAKNITL